METAYIYPFGFWGGRKFQLIFWLDSSLDLASPRYNFWKAGRIRQGWNIEEEEAGERIISECSAFS